MVFSDVLKDEAVFFGPRREHVQAVIDYARGIADLGGKLLIHCQAGVSRSAAAALTVYATWLGTGQEVAAVARMYETSPDAAPNASFVALADELLGRQGALVDALGTAKGRR